MPVNSSLSIGLYHFILTEAVNYVLRGGDLFNMVLLVPDDIPEDSLASTIEGNVEEMCALIKDWDPRYVSILK